MKQKESFIVKEITEYVHSNNGFVIKYMPGLAGVPDLIGGVHNKPFAIEVKTKQGRATPLQRYWLSLFAAQNYATGVVRSLNDFKRVVGQ